MSQQSMKFSGDILRRVFSKQLLPGDLLLTVRYHDEERLKNYLAFCGKNSSVYDELIGGLVVAVEEYENNLYSTNAVHVISLCTHQKSINSMIRRLNLETNAVTFDVLRWSDS